jgi:hypothetical protein
MYMNWCRGQTALQGRWPLRKRAVSPLEIFRYLCMLLMEKEEGAFRLVNCMTSKTTFRKVRDGVHCRLTKPLRRSGKRRQPLHARRRLSPTSPARATSLRWQHVDVPMRDKHQTNKTTPRRTLFSGDSIVDMKSKLENGTSGCRFRRGGGRKQAYAWLCGLTSQSICTSRPLLIKEQIYEDVYKLLSDLVEAHTHTHIYDALQ